MVEVRSMGPSDVAAAERVWHEAWNDLRRRFDLPEVEVTTAVAGRMRARVGHLAETDPAGSYVADDDGEVVGVAQALVREELWVLSLFGVSVRAQSQGIGRRLLDAALSYGSGLPGMILCSRDPRAMRRYVQAGFALHPAVTAWGRVRRDELSGFDAVRAGGARELELAAEVDRRVRGASHGPDFASLLDEGGAFMWHDDGGYVVVREGRPLVLAADSEATASELLGAALASAPDHSEVEVQWLTADQQWAIETSLRAGLELHAVGPVMLRGRTEVPYPYLPNGAFG